MTLLLDTDEPKTKARPRKPARAADCSCTSPTGGACRGTWDVVLIGCGSEKASEPTAAADLYTGSLYTAHRRILTHVGAWPPTAILSAEHGWLAPEQVIEPYKKHIDDLTAEELETWGDRVASRIYPWSTGRCRRRRRARARPASSGFGVDWGGITDELREGRIVVDDPLRGLEVGERLQFAADLIAAGPGTWRAQLEERRAGRRIAAERERRSAAAQLDMFAGMEAA